MLDVIIALATTMLISHRVPYLKFSSVSRLIFFPLLSVIICWVLHSFSVDILKENIILWILSGYFLYQIVNLANTSRRLNFLINLNRQAYEDEAPKRQNQRIQSLIKVGILTPVEDSIPNLLPIKYAVNKNSYLYFIYIV